ncbi:MAG TPA: hypothetical protein VGB85_22255, partial [Nannocystis sp.]
DRVEYLYFAHRAYLALAKKAPASATHDLCKAKQLIDQALALPGTELRERLVASRQETLSRLTEQRAQCRQPSKARKNVALAAPRPAVKTPDPPAGAANPVKPGVSVASDAPTADVTTSLVSAAPAAATPDLMPVTARRVPRPSVVDEPPPRHLVPTRRVDEPRPGRDLVIAGGVTLGLGVGLSVAAGVMGHRLAEKRRDVVALDERIDDYATPTQDAKDAALRREYEAMKPPTVALAITAGATLVVAVILTTIGARRMARSASRTVLAPAPGGLVFHARF